MFLAFLALFQLCSPLGSESTSSTRIWIQEFSHNTGPDPHYLIAGSSTIFPLRDIALNCPARPLIKKKVFPPDIPPLLICPNHFSCITYIPILKLSMGFFYNISLFYVGWSAGVIIKLPKVFFFPESLVSGDYYTFLSKKLLVLASYS